jgi:hypothetical protein
VQESDDTSMKRKFKCTESSKGTAAVKLCIYTDLKEWKVRE